jgi:hypothetical protein
MSMVESEPESVRQDQPTLGDEFVAGEHVVANRDRVMSKPGRQTGGAAGALPCPIARRLQQRAGAWGLGPAFQSDARQIDSTEGQIIAGDGRNAA